MNFCSNCGGKLESNVNFCSNCGSSKSTEQAAPQNSSAQQPSNPFQQPPNKPKKKWSIGKIILTIIGGFFVVVFLLGMLSAILDDGQPSTIDKEEDSYAEKENNREDFFDDEIEEEDETISTEATTGGYSVEGLWELTPESSSNPPQAMEFLPNGTVNWYQTVGSENVMTGTYEVLQGEAALEHSGFTRDDFMNWVLKNMFELGKKFGAVTPEQYIIVTVNYTEHVFDGEITRLADGREQEMLFIMDQYGAYIQGESEALNTYGFFRFEMNRLS